MAWWPWPLTYDLDLWPWPRYLHIWPICQNSGLYVKGLARIVIRKDGRIHTHTHTQCQKYYTNRWYECYKGEIFWMLFNLALVGEAIKSTCKYLFYTDIHLTIMFMQRLDVWGNLLVYFPRPTWVMIWIISNNYSSFYNNHV